MPGADFPPEIRQFIAQYLRSVEQLEILLLVSSRHGFEWSLQAIYDVILSSKQSVERWIEDFVRLGFMVKTGQDPATYRFAAAGDMAATVEKLGALYRLKPVRIIEAIFKRDQNPAQSFADAFKLRKQP